MLFRLKDRAVLRVLCSGPLLPSGVGLRHQRVLSGGHLRSGGRTGGCKVLWFVRRRLLLPHGKRLCHPGALRRLIRVLPYRLICAHRGVQRYCCFPTPCLFPLCLTACHYCRALHGGWELSGHPHCSNQGGGWLLRVSRRTVAVQGGDLRRRGGSERGHRRLLHVRSQC